MDETRHAAAAVRMASAPAPRTAYDDKGTGAPALLLIPGWCESRNVFAPVAALLAAGRRVVSFDLPGHGQSSLPAEEFGAGEVVAATLSVLADGGVGQVIPVAHSHAGWTAIELAHRLGTRLPALILLDWIVSDPRLALSAALAGLRYPDTWEETRRGLSELWLGEVAPKAVENHVRQEMAAHGQSVWARASCEIEQAYRRRGNPLDALAGLQPERPVLHLYGQPRDDAYLALQREFAGTHRWFQAERLEAATHFTTLEVPELVTAAIERFVGAVAT